MTNYFTMANYTLSMLNYACYTTQLYENTCWITYFYYSFSKVWWKFDANYVFVHNGAVFEAGTEDNRYTSKLTITMHGVREDTQIPIYGNKGILARHEALNQAIHAL